MLTSSILDAAWGMTASAQHECPTHSATAPMNSGKAPHAGQELGLKTMAQEQGESETYHNYFLFLLVYRNGGPCEFGEKSEEKDM